MNEIELVFPTEDYEEDVTGYLKEHFDNDEFNLHGDGGLFKIKDFNKWLEKINADRVLIESSETRVPATTYLAVRKKDNKVVGMIQIRHILNEKLSKRGGNIGYGVRPLERRKGYAKEMLKLALEKCRELGINKALLTCTKGNIASAKTMKYNGGILEDEFIAEDGEIVQRYWIKIV